MKNKKVNSLILSSLVFIVGCSSNPMGNNVPSAVDTPTERLELLDSSSKLKGKYSLSESEKDQAKISQDVELFVEMREEGKLKVTMGNHSLNRIDHGYAIFLEKNLKGSWYRVISKADYADESLTLNPGQEFIQNEELENWEESNNPGLFRMVKVYSTDSTKPADETEKISISNEFEIKK